MATPVIESQKPLTAEDLSAMPHDGRKYELVAPQRATFSGELVISSAGMQHEGIAAELTILLGIYLRSNPIGKLFTSSVGYDLPSGDILSPDVSFVRIERLPGRKWPEGFGNFAPDLAVEIISPSDSMTMVEDKIEIYLKNGTQLVWVINPKLRRATVHRADGTLAVVRAEASGSLDGEAVLPGFACQLTDIL